MRYLIKFLEIQRASLKYFPSFLLFTLLLILTFIGLGTWQMYRKTEKETLLKALNQSYTQKPRNVDRITTPSLFEPLYTKGHFVSGKTIFLQSKTFHGKSGVYILDAFQTEGGKFLLIQRGWSAREFSDPPRGSVHVEGIARKPSSPSYFQPKNKAPTYFWIDLKALAQDLNLPLLPYYLVTKDSYDSRIHATNPIPTPSNNHLQYAITWYSLAFSLLVMLWWGRKKYLRKEYP